jgi:glycosyltransferase involved in cell wall biosynthesis
MGPEFVSILMLSHNAPEYVDISIRSVAEKTINVDYELVVVDNASEKATRDLVTGLKQQGLIHKLRMMDRNTLFAEGNNIAAREANPAATYFLLLNSDIEIKDNKWLRHLLDVHKRGITAYGVVEHPDRVDGYCLLIDADLYRQHQLDEGHQWWWGVTRLQAVILRDGLSVQGYAEHERFLHHFGGKSGDAFENAKGMNVTREQVYQWFGGLSPVFLDRQSDGSLPNDRRRPKTPIAKRLVNKIVSVFHYVSSR